MAHLAWSVARCLPRVDVETAITPSGCLHGGRRSDQGSTEMQVQQSTRSQPMQRAVVDGDGTEVEFEIVGSASGGPVLLIHGAFLATAYAPLCAESVLATRELIRYHRRGYAGSSHPSGPASIARQAADCRALLAHLGVE